MIALAFPLGCILAIFLIAALVGLYHVIDAYHIGRALLEAAGSKREARLVIDNVSMDMALARKFGHKMLRQTATPKVVKFVPRIVSGGREVQFGPDGAA